MSTSTPAASLRGRLLLTWLGASAAVLVVCGALYERDVRQLEQSTREREVLRLGLVSRLFTQDFRGVAADVRVLAGSESLQQYLKTGRPDQLAFLVREMSDFARQHPEYDQIGYLNARGREIARVNRLGAPVPPAQLQDKGDRPFFRGAMAAAPGQVYLSAFELNEENGRVEQPPKPTIRLAVPVRDGAGRLRGAVVINYLGANLLDSLKQLSAANQRRTRVLNAQGYWLRAADPADEWGFQLPDRADRTLARSEPALWRQISAATEGQVPFQGGWFTWQRITPAATISGAIAGEPFLILASEFSSDEKSVAIADRQQTYVIVALAMLAAAAGASWFFHARQLERRRAEAALRLARDSAQESTRLKAQFLANMSHEIRTPMNGVVGMIGLLLDTPLSAEQRSLGNIARTSADALLTLINDILDFSKIEAGQLAFEHTPFDLRKPVENCLSLLAERAHAKGLELAYLIEENVPTQLVGDTGRLHQVLLNLVSNALKFTERGEVVLRVAKTGDAERRARLRFTVRDTGIGIPPEAQARLFQPFMQSDGGTTRKFGGTGLGLAICRELVSLMKGEIGLESAPGQGTTFWFTAEFPLQEAAPKVIPRRAALAGARALVVDDNETNREILTRQLAAWQVETQAVAGAEEARAVLRAAVLAGRPFHFGVFDMQMPGMSGLDLARTVHADPALAGLKMIILSSIGHPLAPEVLKAAGLGANLTKPVRQSQLHDTLVTLAAGPAASAADDEIPAFLGASPADVKLRILVAEDNVVNQQVARLQLRRFGYEPHVVAGGEQAIAAVRANIYDVVLMDCQMPDLDGFEATRRIRAWEAGRPAGGEPLSPLYIIAMTANAMTGDRETCLAAGMNDYVTKPVRAADLAAALARAHVPAA